MASAPLTTPRQRPVTGARYCTSTMYAFRPPLAADIRPLLAIGAIALAAAIARSWHGAAAVTWRSAAEAAGVAPGSFWALATATAAGFAATLTANCFAPRALPVAINDNPVRPPLPFRD